MSQAAQKHKSQIRSQIRQLRRQISTTQALEAGHQVCKLIIKHKTYLSSREISCFHSIDGEIDTQPLLSMLIAEKGHCYLPKIKPYKPNRLWFMPYDATRQLKNNRLGIAEVDLPVNHAVRVSSLDIILLPLVAFDGAGNRLGMGGGYYDATFAHLRNGKPGQSRPFFFGVAFHLQKVDKLPAEPWDLPLDGVFTEREFIDFT